MMKKFYNNIALWLLGGFMGVSTLFSCVDEINVGDAELIHRPYVDEVEVKCDGCGKAIKRIPDVLDVWIDSGVAGWASLYYPEEKDFDEFWNTKKAELFFMPVCLVFTAVTTHF